MTLVRARGLEGLHVLALWAIVVAQPLFDLLGKSPEFFVAHRAGRLEILLVVFGLVVLIPSALAGGAWLAGLASRRLGAWVLAAVIGGLTAMLAMQVLKHAGMTTAGRAIPIAAAIGIAAATAYHRLPIVRTSLTVLSLGVAVVPAVFMLQPPIRRALAPAADAPESPVRAAVDLLARRRMAPVVLIVLDETPLASLLDADGKIDPVLYPHLAALAHEGTWYRNATTVSDYTRWALPSLVTGRNPVPDAAPAASDYPQTIFTLLARTHHVEGLEAVTRLCPDRICGASPDPLWTRVTAVFSDLRVVYLHVLLTDDLRAGLPSLTGDWANFGAAAGARQRDREARRRFQRQRRRAGGDDPSGRTSVMRDFISRIDPADPQPSFYFIHTMLPHTPHVLLPTGQINGTRATSGVLELPRALPGQYRDAWTDDEWVVTQNYQRHLLQLGFVDVMLGELVARLKDVGLYERSLLVVVADHGAAFQSGFPRRDFTEQTAAAIMRVPLVIKYPAGTREVAGVTREIGGQRVNDRIAQTVDIVPTIATVLGIDVPWQTDGHSLLDAGRPEPAARTIYFDFARHTRTFDRGEPDVGPVLRRRLAIFGGPENRSRVPTPSSFGELLGQPIADIPQSEEGGGIVAIDFLSEFTRMDPRAEIVPFDVAGRFVPRRTAGRDVYLAVAVNGRVGAVTRTWRAQPGEWLATPPLDSWTEGRNTLEVFVVEATARGPVLRRCDVRQGKSR